jgi:hypothetical protein
MTVIGESVCSLLVVFMAYSDVQGPKAQADAQEFFKTLSGLK